SIEQLPYFTPATMNGHSINNNTLAIDQKISSNRASVAELINITVEDLIKRKASKPRTPKTLMSTIHAKCGKDTLAADIEAVYKGLMSRGYIKVNGAKLSYDLPVV
ncbi:MAG: hypothetical protein EBU46_11220, partial [Nitrosomonadaceae bacterium]|nr:hypothetical protein [Nitrosomonadaceae bacterium]